jgi:hypothetical protein
MHWCNLINPLLTALDGSLDSEEDLTKEGEQVGRKVPVTGVLHLMPV